MRETIIFTTKNDNSYIYDPEKMLTGVIHPDLKKVHQRKINVNPYYLKKYEYLKKNDFFAKPALFEFETKINESIVKESLIQTQQIVFETTDYCNLNCTYCSLGDIYEGFGKSSPKNINYDHAIKLLQYIINLKYPKTKLLISFFGGEPLINIEFIKRIVSAVKKMNFEKDLNISFHITTNGTLLHKCLAFLVENNFSLLISLDGNKKNHTYRIFKNNKKNSFDEVIKNVDMIQQEYPEYFREKVAFNAVLHDRNSIKEIYEFISGRYNKFVKIQELNSLFVRSDQKEIYERMFHDKRKDEESLREDKSYPLSLIQENTIIFSDVRSFIKNDSINFYVSNLLYLSSKHVKRYPSSTCMPFAKKIFLSTHSDICLCEKIKQKYSLGKVDEDVMLDLSSIVKKYNIYFDGLQKICQACYSVRSCSVCMYNIENLDKLEDEAITCFAFQNREKYENKLSLIFSFFEKYPIYIKLLVENK